MDHAPAGAEAAFRTWLISGGVNRANSQEKRRAIDLPLEPAG